MTLANIRNGLGRLNGFDTVAVFGGFGGVGVGVIATLLVFNSYWKCLFRVRNASLASFLFVMATIFQGMTAMVRVSGACGEQYH